MDLDGYDFVVYPNPVKDQLHINHLSLEEVYWELHDLYGKVVLSGHNKNNWEISMNNLSPGTYMLQMESSNKSIMYKVIKQ